MIRKGISASTIRHNVEFVFCSTCSHKRLMGKNRWICSYLPFLHTGNENEYLYRFLEPPGTRKHIAPHMPAFKTMNPFEFSLYNHTLEEGSKGFIIIPNCSSCRVFIQAVCPWCSLSSVSCSRNHWYRRRHERDLFTQDHQGISKRTNPSSIHAPKSRLSWQQKSFCIMGFNNKSSLSPEV